MAEKQTTEKPIDKMTVKELKEVAKSMPEITGVHGMNKEELLTEIKKAKGIVEKKEIKIDEKLTSVKKKIKDLKVLRATALESKDKKMATIYRRKISKLKKKTRHAA